MATEEWQGMILNAAGQVICMITFVHIEFGWHTKVCHRLRIGGG